MTAADPRCAVLGCEDPALGPHAGHLAPWCTRHRYWQPVQHAPRECPGCGSTFAPRRADQAHCSKRCRNRLSARRTYEPRPRGPKLRRNLTCEACGLLYLGVWGRYCSRACQARAWRDRRRPEYLEGKRRHRRAAKARGAEWALR